MSRSWIAGAVVGGAAVVMVAFAPWMERDAESFAGALDRELASSGFSGSALVAQGDRVLLDRGYGMASAADGAPNRPETVFKIASLTKPITAVAVLMLVDQGRLDLHEPIATYLPGFPGGAEITAHHLLTHTSGLARDLAPFVDVRPQTTAAEAVAAAPRASVMTGPGVAWSYSNYGYQVLEVLVERISGLPFAEYVEREVFAPAGMVSATLRPAGAPPPHGSGFARTATGPGDRVAPSTNAEAWWGGAGAGGALASTHDLLRFHRALQSEALLSAELLEVMYSEAVAGYGYGWYVSVEGRLVWHSGDLVDEGFHSWFVRDLDRDVAVVLLANTATWNDNADFLIRFHTDDPEVRAMLSLWPVPLAMSGIAAAAAAHLVILVGRLRLGTHRLRRPGWRRLLVHAITVSVGLVLFVFTLNPLRSASWTLAWTISPTWAKISPLGAVVLFVSLVAASAGVIRPSSVKPGVLPASASAAA